MERKQELGVAALANVACERAEDGTLVGTPTSPDPQLRIELVNGPIEAGFWELRVELLIKPGAVARIYPDFGHGVAESSSIALLPSGKEAFALVYFPAPVVALRLDPDESSDPFRIRSVRLERLSARRALWLFARHVLGSSTPSASNDYTSKALDRLLALVRNGDVQGGWDTLTELVRAEPTVPRRPVSYNEWVKEHDPLNSSESDAIRAREWPEDESVLISILMPACNPDPRRLRAAAESVLRQSYPFWELCIVADIPTSAATHSCLRDLASVDPRIRVSYRAEHADVSRATNRALEISRGEYIAILDHHDELHPFALSYVAEALRKHPQATLVYTDEDKIDDQNERFDPYFKPDWNLELLLGQNFISHLAVYPAERVKKLGGMRIGFEGCQDHDLVLRVVEGSAAEQIIHVPKVLYHRRAFLSSRERSSSQKRYASEAGRLAVQDHLRRSGERAEAVLEDSGRIRVCWELPNPPPRVSVIIPTRDRADLLRKCVASVVEKTAYDNCEVIVVDNGSTEQATITYLEELKAHGVRVLDWPHPFNYSDINNFAVKEASGDVVALLNNDVEVIDPGWLAEMVSHAIRPGVGAVGAKLFYPDGSIQHAGVVLGVHGVAAHQYCGMPGNYSGQMDRANLLQSFSAVTAACLVIEKVAFESIGGFDPELAVAFNDIDLCLRLGERGLRCVWTPYARLYHHESVSRGREDTLEKQARFQKEVAIMRERWGARLDSDPYYNPNLTRSGEPFSLSL